MAMLRFMDDNMDNNMDDNIVPADQSQAFLQRAQSQSTSISSSPALESGRHSAENLFIFPENVTHPKYDLLLLVFLSLVY